MGSLAGPKAWREPAGEAKPDVCVISDVEAGAYCTVGLVPSKSHFVQPNLVCPVSWGTAVATFWQCIFALGLALMGFAFFSRLEYSQQFLFTSIATFSLFYPSADLNQRNIK